MRRTHIVLEDDRDGGEAHETVTFSFDQVDYEIDLSKENADKFAELIHDWAKDARVTSKKKPKRPSDGEASKIREWAREQGIEVPARGRIPQEIKTAYHVGHQ